MLKKLLCFSIILIVGILLLNISYATDIVMDLDSNNTVDTTEQSVDNTIYSSDSEVTETTEAQTDTTTTDYEQVATTTTTDYEEDTDLSISNIINIILIAVGLVLILLGIAIIIKIK